MTTRAPRGAILVAGPRTRRWFLFSHLVTAGGWIGIDLVPPASSWSRSARRPDDPGDGVPGAGGVRRLADADHQPALPGQRAAAHLTGTYGLLRFWWVVIKLVLNVLLSTLVLLLLRPGAIDMTEAGRALMRGEHADTGFVDTRLFPPIVSGTLLLVASALAVLTPWARTQWSVRRS